MLNVGVHENIQFSKATRNDKGTLVVGFKKAVANKLAALSAGKFEPEERDIMIFPPQLTNFGGALATAKEMLTKWSEVFEPLGQIAEQFMTKDKVNWDLFLNTGITEDNYEEKMLLQETVDKIYNNIVDQFLTMVRSHVNSSRLFRVVLIRTSKTKHYPKLRTRFLDNQPFIEPMEVSPAKVKFSKYEVENGLNNTNQAGAASIPSIADATEADSIFSETVVA